MTESAEYVAQLVPGMILAAAPAYVVYELAVRWIRRSLSGV